MKNIIQDIKYKRMKPEERFLYDILTNIEIVKYKKYPNSEFYKLNDKILFEQDSNNDKFFVNYNKIWSVLQSKYGLNYQEIRVFIKVMVWKTLERKVGTPGIGVSISEKRCGKPLKER